MKVAVDVLFQSPNYSTGALSWFTQFMRIAPARDRRIDFIFLTGNRDVAYYREKNPAVQVEAAGWGNDRRLLRILSEHFLLAPALRRVGADILFHGSSGVAPLVMPRKTKLILAIWGIQHLAAGDIRWEQRIYRRLLFRRGLRRADAILVNSAYSRDLLLSHYPNIRTPVEVVHHGVDFNIFYPGPNTEELAKLGLAGPYILFVGQLYPYKLLHVQAEAFARTVGALKLPHKLVVVGNFTRTDSMGSSYRVRIARILADAGLGDRLVTLDKVEVQALRALYAAADLYVQPSTSETFGRTIIEAMACGAPILAARAGATPEILAEAGCYYEALDVASCAAQMRAVLTNDVVRRDLKARGLERARDFRYEGELDRLIAIFHRVGAG